MQLVTNLNMANIDWNMINPLEIPSNLILNHPIVEELTNSLELKIGQGIAIPYVLTNCRLMSPGTWNNIYYSEEVLKDAFEKTDWSDRSVTALFEDHEDNSTGAWIGEVKNVRFKDGSIYGDLYIYDLDMALKLAVGKPRFGISPKLEGTTDASRREMKECVFKNFSLVVNPACKTTYLNSLSNRLYIEQEVVSLTEEENKKETPEEKKKEPEKYPEETEAKCSPEKKDDEKLSAYIEFVKDYLKKHPGADLEEAAKAWKAKEKLSELSDADIISQIVELLELLKKKKYPEPEKFEEMAKVVQEMSEKIEKIEEKLNQPERLTANVNQAQANINVDSDYVMMHYLKGVSK